MSKKCCNGMITISVAFSEENQLVTELLNEKLEGKNVEVHEVVSVELDMEIIDSKIED